jgi:hypothetical protein
MIALDRKGDRHAGIDTFIGILQPVRSVFSLEGRPPWSRSPFSISTISPAVVGFLILFNAREKIF